MHTRDSTLDTLSQYEYTWTGTPPQVGDTIELRNSITGEKKFIDIEYIKILKNGYIIKNSNNTIKLVRS